MDERPHDEKRMTPGGFPRLTDADGAEYDALTELFLGDPGLAPKPASVGARTGGAPRTPPVASEGGAAPRVESEPAQGVTVEAVLLGHLPVRASIWVRQYASSIAAGLGRPVGLLRVGPEVSSVELVGAGSDELAAGIEPAEALADALRRASGLTDRWIVRVDETAEPGLSECGSVDEVTILTGADEAAVVASYRLVKSLAARWDGSFGAEGGPTLGLAIMGSSGEQALAASEKLERAAEAFLNRPIRVTARVPKIGVSSAATLYRGNEAPETAELLELLKAEPTPLRIAPDWRPSEPAEDRTLEDIEFEAAETAGLDAAVEELEIEAGAALAEPETPDEAPVAEGPKPEVVTRPVFDVQPKAIERVRVSEPVRLLAPAPEPEPVAAPAPAVDAGDAVAAQEREDALAALLGMEAIESRCPFAGAVELAADEAGRLHLIASDRDQSGREATTQLLAAASWARAHLALLLRAEPALAQPTADDPHEPTMHLLTDDARSVRAILDADVRVHLVTRVSLGGRTGWVAAELN